jgi:hypothetical protein
MISFTDLVKEKDQYDMGFIVIALILNFFLINMILVLQKMLQSLKLIFIRSYLHAERVVNKVFGTDYNFLQTYIR